VETEDNTIKNSPKKWLTVERVLLCIILLLQTTILFSLWRDGQERESKPVVSDSRPGQGTSSLTKSRPVHDVVRVPMPARLAHLQAASRMFDEMDQMFQGTIGDFGRMGPFVDLDSGWDSIMASPAMDMKEKDNRYVVVFSLPGVRSSDVRVSLEGRMLTVYTDVRSMDGYGEHIATFERAVQLPGPVADAQLAEATLTNGVLRISVPKTTGDEPSSKSKRLL